MSAGVPTNKAFRQAVVYYERFHLKDFDADECRRIGTLWPEKWGVVCNPTTIGYRSDKWNEDGDWVDYTHDFESETYCLRDYVRGDEVFKRRGYGVPRHPYFSYLGYCLDLDYEDEDEEENYFDWTHLKHLPLLLWFQPKRWLIIHHATRKRAPLIVTNRGLRVTKRGIEG